MTDAEAAELRAIVSTLSRRVDAIEEWAEAMEAMPGAFTAALRSALENDFPSGELPAFRQPSA